MDNEKATKSNQMPLQELLGPEKSNKRRASTNEYAFVTNASEVS